LRVIPDRSAFSNFILKDRVEFGTLFHAEVAKDFGVADEGCEGIYLCF